MARTIGGRANRPRRKDQQHRRLSLLVVDALTRQWRHRAGLALGTVTVQRAGGKTSSSRVEGDRRCAAALQDEIRRRRRRRRQRRVGNSDRGHTHQQNAPRVRSLGTIAEMSAAPSADAERTAYRLAAGDQCPNRSRRPHRPSGNKRLSKHTPIAVGKQGLAQRRVQGSVGTMRGAQGD